MVSMTVIPLVQRVIGANSRQTALHDVGIETGGIAIDQDGYTAGLDRVYDVKGLKNMVAKIKNTGGSNGLTFTIENSTIEFEDIDMLVDADFDGVILADTPVAALADSVQSIIDISPESTAIRIRFKRQTASLDTTLAGSVSVN